MTTHYTFRDQSDHYHDNNRWSWFIHLLPVCFYLRVLNKPVCFYLDNQIKAYRLSKYLGLAHKELNSQIMVNKLIFELRLRDVLKISVCHCLQ